ncbi:MAG TPA: phosphoribosyltransferase family protein [Acidothermaceae bacterium]|nr:phosphoribosyltransferase family protein [Acidothermaceae bacterium]
MGVAELVAAMVRFDDRADAGRRLAVELEWLHDDAPVVLGLPRGGVPVGFAVAEKLAAPFDVVVVRKLGVPYWPELAMGAIGEDGVRVVDAALMARERVSDAELEVVERRECAVLTAYVARFCGGRERVDVHGRVAVVVDDGMATGLTARAACEVVRRHGASRVIMAVPVAPAETVERFDAADSLVCLAAPHAFGAVGSYFRDFSQTTDREVIRLLDAARSQHY